MGNKDEYISIWWDFKPYSVSQSDCSVMFQVNGESLLGARHKHALNVVKSLHDNALLLICDGYNVTDVPQAVPAKVNQGHEPQCRGDEVAVRKLSQGRGLAVQSSGAVLDKDCQVVQDHEMVSNKVAQNQELEFQHGEVVSDGVVQGQGPEFEGREKVNSVSGLTADEHRRERARQRRLARYSLAYFVRVCLFVCLSVCPLVSLCVHLSVCLFVCVSDFLSDCSSSCSSVCLFLCLSVSLSVCPLHLCYYGFWVYSKIRELTPVILLPVLTH